MKQMVHKQAWSIKNYRYVSDVSPFTPTELMKETTDDDDAWEKK
jgi:hypothetical protein